MTLRRAVALLLVVAALAAACTDDTPSSSTTTTTTGTTTEPGPTGAATDDTGTTASGPAPSATSTLPAVDGATYADGRTPVPGFAEVALRIVTGPDGEPVVICVLVAETAEQRRRGLMGVTDLGGYDGMVFRFEADSDGGFWMRDTLLPLSIAYLDADGAVVSTADMDPCPVDAATCPSYPAAGPYRSALEVPRGGLDELGLTTGSATTVTDAGACPPRE